MPLEAYKSATNHATLLKFHIKVSNPFQISDCLSELLCRAQCWSICTEWSLDNSKNGPTLIREFGIVSIYIDQWIFAHKYFKMKCYNPEKIRMWSHLEVSKINHQIWPLLAKFTKSSNICLNFNTLEIC